jgi:hypothetical protein
MLNFAPALNKATFEKLNVRSVIIEENLWYFSPGASCQNQ